MINTATLVMPRNPTPAKIFSRQRFGSLAHPSFQLGTKEILVLFRLLVFLVIVILLFFNEKMNQDIFRSSVEIFLWFFAASILGMIFLGRKWFENKAILSILFVADIFFITIGLYFSGVLDADLFLIFFTTVFISTLSQDVKSVFS